MLAKPRTTATPTLARPIRHSRCHANFSGQTGSSLGLCNLHPQLLAGNPPVQRKGTITGMAKGPQTEARAQDWHAHWQPTEDNNTMPRQTLQQEARTQAAQLPELTIGHLAKTLKKLPDRACGPDAISTQMLRTAPPQALPGLLKIFQDIETTATLTTQLQMSNNEKVERPIALTSVLYCTWCRLRQSILD